MKPLPSKKDFGDIADLDVRYAWKTFGGKSVEEAYAIVQSNPFHYQENFRWMATPAFVFYFPVIARYIMSDAAKGDSDTVSSFTGTLEDRVEEDFDRLKSISKQIRSLCDHVITHYEDYGLNYDIYGDVKTRYEKMKKDIEREPS